MRNSHVDTEVRGEGGAPPGARAGTVQQPVEETMLEQISTMESVEHCPLEQVVIPWRNRAS